MAKTVTVTIDGIKVSAPDGELLIETAKRIGQHVPNFCYHAKLAPAGLCRMCLVRIEGQPKLQIGCNTRVTDGMVVDTVSEPVETGRRAQLEFLLLNHPLDCPICDKGGECDLQDYTVAFGQDSSRSGMAKMNKPKAVDLGPTIVLDEQRCVLCQRCVRFDDEITSERRLVTAARGVQTIIATEDSRPYASYFSGNTTELCPVGALTSKTYRFKARPWDVKPTLTTCTQCPVGCSTFADSRFDVLLRTRYDHVSTNPHLDPAGDWLCDRGRYNIGFLADQRRLSQPMVRSGEDQWVDLAWSDAAALVAKTLKDSAEHFGPESIGAIGGGRLTNEEAYLLQYLMRGLGSPNVDHRTHGELTATPGRLAAGVRDLDDADVILEVGADTVEQAPVLELRVRYAVRRRGARLIHVGDAKPNRPLETHHYGAGDAAALLSEAAANLRHAEDVPKQSGAPDAVALARLLRGGERIVVIWDGKGDAAAAAVERLIDVLRDGDKHAALLVVGHSPNARGAEAMGMHPAFLPGYRPAERAGLSTEGMLRAAARGELKALVIFGANPLLSYPDGALVRAALERVPFLVTAEIFMTGTAVRSHVVLPVLSSYEKAGHVTALDGETKRVAVSCRPHGGEPLADREILFLLADAIGLPVPGEGELEEAAITLPAAETQRGLAPGSAAAVVGMGNATAGGDLTVLTLPRLYAGGGTSANDRALEAELRPRPTAFVNAADAGRLGLDDGDVVDLRNAAGALEHMMVVVSDDVPAGTVGVIGALPEAPANALADGVGRVGATLTLVKKGERAAALAGAQGE